ncbi:MAG TPA: ATP-binding protein [Bacteroidales bacterium]|nr:ATP-binding protein [Bacteroidales bacterium]
MMHYSDPKSLSLWSALYVTIFYSALFIGISLLLGDINGLLLLFSAPILFLFIYFLARFILEKFIYEKIRPIYKTILSTRNPDRQGRDARAIRADMINNVNEHVREWEQRKVREIDQLKKLESYRREFIGNISHELKTPIFNIQGYVLTLLDGGLEDPKINRDYLLKTEQSVERLITIVEDLEMISRLESGQLKLENTRFDLVGLTMEVIEFLEDKARKRKVTLRLEKAYEKPVYVFADRNRIRQVLTNLLDNSIIYGNKKGITRVGFFDMDKNLLVEVTDDGEGIAPEDLPRLFERFYRTDKARSREKGGSGLGLAIVKHIIEAHDQTIHVRSTLGVGTTFGFTLKKA